MYLQNTCYILYSEELKSVSAAKLAGLNRIQPQIFNDGGGSFPHATFLNAWLQPVWLWTVPTRRRQPPRQPLLRLISI